MWVSGEEGNGFDIAFSSDLQNKIQGTLNGCKEKNDKCYQDLENLIDASTLELDKKLERRQLAVMLAGAFEALAAVGAAVIAVLMAHLDVGVQPEPIPVQGHFVPEDQASSAGIVATASEVIVSGADSVIMTITPTSEPATLTG